MSKYGLWEFGTGSGNYRPASPNARTETAITNEAIKKASKLYKDGVIYKIHGGGYQRSGIPDVYVGIENVSIWVEFKRPGADTTQLQLKKLQALQKAGIYCGTAESTETFLEIIEQALKEGLGI